MQLIATFRSQFFSFLSLSARRNVSFALLNAFSRNYFADWPNKCLIRGFSAKNQCHTQSLALFKKYLEPSK